jgi:Na+/proline symporter
MLVATATMPHALRGILIAGFMAAFMSTIATQLNWGSSYLVEDFYRRFIRRDGTEKHYVNISRIATLLLVAASAYVSAQLVTISQGWEVVLEVGAGTGGVYLLRWYWWRINAWSEISAMATALGMTVILHHWQLFGGSAPVIFAKTTLVTTGVTTIVWVSVTLLTPAEPAEVLLRFYREVRPHVAGWRRIAVLAREVPETRDLGKNLVAWILGCAMVYAALFGIGKLCLGDRGLGLALLALSMICAALLYRDISKRVASEPMGGTVV